MSKFALFTGLQDAESSQKHLNLFPLDMDRVASTIYCGEFFFLDTIPR